MVMGKWSSQDFHFPVYVGVDVASGTVFTHPVERKKVKFGTRVINMLNGCVKYVRPENMRLEPG